MRGKRISGKIYQKYFNKTKSLENVGLKRKKKNIEQTSAKSAKLLSNLK